jgi:hypothetical protein
MTKLDAGGLRLDLSPRLDLPGNSVVLSLRDDTPLHQFVRIFVRPVIHDSLRRLFVDPVQRTHVFDRRFVDVDRALLSNSLYDALRHCFSISNRRRCRVSRLLPDRVRAAIVRTTTRQPNCDQS